MIRTAILSALALVWALLPPPGLQAKAAHTLKIASLAPEGSVWVDSFKEFAAEVSDKTGGEVAFRIYPGGIMGDDKAMYRKMRVGQLHGGGFTMTGIADIVPDFRVMAIPFLFHSYEEVDRVSAELQPLFRKRFSEKGLYFSAMTEVGFIYTFSNEPRLTVNDLQRAKTWAPSNDPLTSAFLNNLDISPITLSIPDVLSSLQTGLIDTAFNSLYGSIILQWYTKAPFVTDAPYGYAYGALILSAKAVDKLSDQQRAIIDEAARTHFGTLIDKTRQSNEESRAVLSNQGVTFVNTTAEVLDQLEAQRDRTIDQVMGSAFSEEIYTIVSETLNTMRTGSDGSN
jgi:TRAP-type C4-dicarboxylate transport system substrate-binding protein